jgi:signal transduction histidine kinase
VDWTEEDFPDPGLYPVYFGDIHKRVTQIRLTVPQIPNASGAAYYAIGEIHPFQQRPDGTTGANMAEWGSGHVEIEESEPFSQPPFWDISYLHDGVVGLGFPLSDELVKSEDLWVTYEHQDDLNVEVELLLDLGQLRPIGRVDFWPAKAPHSLTLPSFGFPSDIQVELSETADFSVVKVLRVKNGEEVGHFDNVLSVVGQAYDARYIRVTIRGLPEHQGKPILGLGEIFVTEFDEPYSLGCKVTARGIPEKDLDQLPRLVDGCSWQRRILPEGEWIRGLAQRRPLDRRLALVEEELELARSNWQGIKRQWLLTGSVFLLFAFFVVLIVQRRIRIQGINKFKMRVARDLHDDVGSNLGSISLTVEHLKDLEVGDAVKAELGDLSLLAREACASLREVVWVIDERTIRLPDLIGKLAERAERVLHGIDLSVERPEFCPEVEVSLPFKRNLIMFFKEAIHNCARHSQASHVWVRFLTKDKKLQIIVRDDGCGFDPQLQFTGWGLESMKDRAREIGGRVDIRSQSGQGTEVILKVPFSCLLTQKDDFYKTSN